MLVLVAILAVCALALCVSDWRSGMLVCIVVGFLSDTVRKVVPDQPVYFVVIVGVFVAAVAVGFLRQHGLVDFTKIRLFRGPARVPLMLFLVWLAFQSAVSYGRYGSITLIAVGLLSYLAPLPGFLVAYYYGLRIQSSVRFVKVYIWCALPMLGGILLSYSGVESPLLEEVGTGVLIFVPGGILDSYPGFLRSTEIAAWHAAAAVCLILVLTVSGALGWSRLLVALVVIALLYVGLLTGRRKMLMEVFIFVGLYGALLLLYRREIGKIIGVAAVIVAVLGIAGAFGVLERSATETQRIDVYVERGATVFIDAEERFAELGLGSVGWALDRFGLFGGGIGVASQGGQHFGGGAARFGGAGEGGLGKIVAELGVPGLMLVFWIIGALLLYLARLIPEVARLDSPIVPLFLGFVSFLGANVPVFIVATQVFGDLFVLLILGWVFGFSMAMSEVVLAANANRPYASASDAKQAALA
jgi:hypothetical protein